MSEKLTFDISWRGLRSIDCNCCMKKKTHLLQLVYQALYLKIRASFIVCHLISFSGPTSIYLSNYCWVYSTMTGTQTTGNWNVPVWNVPRSKETQLKWVDFVEQYWKSKKNTLGRKDDQRWEGWNRIAIFTNLKMEKEIIWQETLQIMVWFCTKTSEQMNKHIRKRGLLTLAQMQTDIILTKVEMLGTCFQVWSIWWLNPSFLVTSQIASYCRIFRQCNFLPTLPFLRLGESLWTPAIGKPCLGPLEALAPSKL